MLAWRIGIFSGFAVCIACGPDAGGCPSQEETHWEQIWDEEASRDDVRHTGEVEDTDVSEASKVINSVSCERVCKQLEDQQVDVSVTSCSFMDEGGQVIASCEGLVSGYCD